jgi:general secretion pathway protein L
MSADVYIELPAGTSGTPRLAVRRSGALQPALFDSYRASGRPKAIAFAPALAVAKFRVSVAATSEAEARKAALYAVEDDIAQSVEDVHILLGPKQSGSRERDIYVADKALMQHWMQQLQTIGLGHAEIVPESSLDLVPGTVIDFGDRLLMHGAQGVIGADRAWPENVLWEILRKSGLETANVTSAGALETLAALEARAPGVRLAGPRSGIGAREPDPFRRWRLAGLLAIAAASVWTASLHLEINRLLTTAQQQEAQARSVYRAQFGGMPEPADIHAEVRRLSAATSGESDIGFLDLTAAVYQAQGAPPGAQLWQLRYSDPDGTLRAVLRFASAPEAEAFQAQLESAGWTAETESLADLAPGIEATFIVRAAP